MNTFLTSTEHLVLQLIAYEYSSSRIAELLFVSVQTIYTHRANLLSKLSVKNTAGMVRKAIERELLIPFSQLESHPRLLHLKTEATLRMAV